MNATYITHQAQKSLALALIFTVLLATGFFVVEPTMSRAAASATDVFTIRQEITDEISFLVAAADVTMVGSIQGVSGGTATGTTFAVIRSNSNSGFTMDVAFSNNPAMRGETTLSNSIRDYGVPGAEPTFAFNASTSAQFAYTVAASTTSDLDPSFLNNGTNCNTGASYTAAACWKGPSTSNFRIINRATSAPSGATTTLTFRVTVPSNPTPSLDEDFYTATATLTATNQ
jgi:hypothetical protein